MNSVRAIVSQKCQLAEGPLWHQEQRRLYWADIPAGRLYRYDPEAGLHECFHAGEPVGGFVFHRDASLVLFRVRDVCRIDFDGNVLAIQPVDLAGMQRFNDVIAAPDGSVFAGTIGKTSESGGLYHFRTDGTVSRLFAGTGCSNGMGFSPDGRGFYWTCSTTRRIYAFDYQEDRVRVESRRLFYPAPEEEGIPDGMAVDAEGNIWSARWDGFQLVKISPSGEKLDSVAVPRARASSVCFGGPQLDRLFITAAATDGFEENADQCLFEGDAGGASGLPEFFSSLDLSRPFEIVS